MSSWLLGYRRYEGEWLLGCRRYEGEWQVAAGELQVINELMVDGMQVIIE